MPRTIVALVVVLGLVAAGWAQEELPWIAKARLGMVVSDSPDASLMGAQALALGGNAFDAAIVTSLSLAVTRPQSTGLGGGGFMIAYVAKDNRFVALDFRETAPAAATRERYAKLLAEAGDGPPPTLYGGAAVAVPGLVAGLGEIHRRYATRPMSDLTALAVFLTQSGFAADEHYLKACRSVLDDYAKWPQLKERCARTYETLLREGNLPKIGERVRRPDLTDTLKLLGDQGAEPFYTGEVAAAIVEAVQAAGGLLTKEDLAGYRVKEREPLRFNYRGYEIVTMPPPSSGGVCIAQTLNILATYAGDSATQPVAGRTHILAEALKHAFADRARYLGDPDFGSVPVARFLDVDHARELARRIQPDKTLSTKEYGTVAPAPEDRGTSHFCVADKDGNIVTMTETINGLFGSLVVAGSYGIVLNNEMDDFTMPSDRPNLYGLVQSPANLVAPGKRPLSSMSPTLVCKDGKPVLALGASGGPRIITSVVQVMLTMLDQNQRLEQALPALRLHHQWQPDELYFDQEPPKELAEALKTVGHKLSDERKTGIVQALVILPNGWVVGGCDPRGSGRPGAVLE
jgi:gamma-glutamyltranspeptidase/glutathione hydrolase